MQAEITKGCKTVYVFELHLSIHLAEMKIWAFGYCLVLELWNRTPLGVCSYDAEGYYYEQVAIFINMVTQKGCEMAGDIIVKVVYRKVKFIDIQVGQAFATWQLCRDADDQRKVPDMIKVKPFFDENEWPVNAQYTDVYDSNHEDT